MLVCPLTIALARPHKYRTPFWHNGLRETTTHHMYLKTFGAAGSFARWAFQQASNILDPSHRLDYQSSTVNRDLKMSGPAGTIKVA